MVLGKNLFTALFCICILCMQNKNYANNSNAFIEKPTPNLPKKPSSKINVVIIDAGHGGKDVGAVGLQSTEKQITLIVAKKLHAKLSANYPDIKFVMTRQTDMYDNVRTKAQKANNAKGDLFICIHVNSSGSKPGGWYKTAANGQRVYVKNEAHGTETYVWAADKTSSKESFIKNQRYTSKAETEGISMAKGSQEESIAASLKAKKYFKNSVKLANYIEQENAKVGRNSRGVKQRNDEGIWVLQATGMPSVLTEIGFNSNLEEEAYMVSNDGQNQIVDCIANAFARYKDDVENTNNPNPTAVRKKKLLYTANSSPYLAKL
jgi:N-acetylmuramoyl-L-alanine amidase